MNKSTINVRRLAATWMAAAVLTACGGGGGGGVSAPVSSATAGSTAGASTGSGTVAGGSTTTLPTTGVGTGGTGVNTGVGTGGTGALAIGAISGFGSIIVNGVRYDDSTARVLDDDGVSRSRDDLRLGMTVEIRASAPTVDAAGVARATASEVRFSRSLTGPITSLNAGAATLVIFGQTVVVTSTTLFDGVSGLAGLQAGQVVEVYAQADAQGRQVATRIERKDAASSAGSNSASLRLSGFISNLSADRLQFRLGTVTVLVGSPLPASLVNGSEVRVVARATTTDGVLTALSVQSRSSVLGSDVSSAEVEGFVTAFTSAASFSVNGVPVVTMASTRVEGVAANLRLGAKVEVEGSVSAGVITATRLEIESDDDSSSSSSGSSAGAGGSSSSGSTSGSSSGQFEIHGAISALDKAAMKFVVRGLTVTWDASTQFKDGTAAMLANGRNVEVKAIRGADGVSLRATRISFED